jgi:hypothetical protein
MPEYPESWMYTAAAHDALANAVEAGWKWTRCPKCGGEGYWAREGETWPCPLCDAPLVYPRVPAPAATVKRRVVRCFVCGRKRMTPSSSVWQAVREVTVRNDDGWRCGRTVVPAGEWVCWFHYKVGEAIGAA